MVRSLPPGIYKPGGGLVRSKSSGLAGRLGVKPDLGKPSGAIGKVGDARSQLAQGKIIDARDLLGQKAKTMDARQKLEKMRNLKDGNLEVKKVGGITVTKKVGGGIVLSTKSKEGGGAATPGLKEVKQIGRLTKTVNSSGQVSLSSKRPPAKPEAAPRPRSLPPKPSSAPRSRPEGIGGGSVLRGAGGGQKENRAVGRPTGTLGRDIDRLDEELLNTQVDPGLLQRTVETSRRQHVGRRARSRSPVGRDRSPIARGRNFDYDDPRAASDRDGELQRRRMRDQDTQREDITVGRTMASRLESSGGLGVSPLQGTKIVIQNLQNSVTQEDILELFGDIGALRRAKLVTPGHAEVTFVNKSDAARAVEIYHNRQLDGKPMKCQMVGVGNTVAPGGATMKLPKELQGSKDRRGPVPDMDSIHRALFNKKTTVGKKQTFTITMPKKSRDEQDRW